MEPTPSDFSARRLLRSEGGAKTLKLQRGLRSHRCISDVLCQVAPPALSYDVLCLSMLLHRSTAHGSPSRMNRHIHSHIQRRPIAKVASLAPEMLSWHPEAKEAKGSEQSVCQV